MISIKRLNDFVGQPVGAFCPNKFDAATQNHCAHFAAHALGLQVGILCGDMTSKTRHTGASIRCNELYNGLARKGPWAERPTADDGLLVFVLAASNVVGNVMRPVDQKHVGIHFGGRVFNFSNGRHEVAVDATVEGFLAKFSRIYAGDDIALFYGVAP